MKTKEPRGDESDEDFAKWFDGIYRSVESGLKLERLRFRES